ncbi:MAG: signal transduction histidine kinase [Natronomonas sp.]|jgi:signal transduction histidine kinase|uniref:sensor histidine kinase n=1 Tax=Natronomonas sp. TaxID=2184060 RepID=UPI0039899F90
MIPGVSLTFLLATSYAIAIALTATIAGYCFLERSSRVARVFGTCMVTLALWSVGAFGRLFSATEAAWYVWTAVMYLGVVLAAVLFFVFAMVYSGRERNLTPGRTAALFVLPTTSLVLIATNPSHGLFFADVTEATLGANTVYTTISGPWFWVHTTYSYALFGIATALLAQFAANNHRIYRKQTLAVLGGAIIPWVVNAAYVFYVGMTFPVDPTPVGFAVGSCLLAYAVLGGGLTQLTPIARSAVVDAIDDAVFVLDGNDRIVDLNPAAEDLIEGVEEPVGKSVSAVVPSVLLTDDDTVPITVDGQERWYQPRRLPLVDDGVVLLVSDLTNQMRNQRQLRQQNRRLEEFTRVAAHDLRNPLTTITGYTQLAQETGDFSHLDRVGPAAGRIETLIDDLLTLGREGQVVEEEDITAVSLSSAAVAAWRNLETDGATLERVDDVYIEADETRFRQLLEHLFANCVEHGGRDGTDGVSVTVGALSDGFFVGDDGTGIPTDSRADVFEYSYSTHGGTGLGLPVVRSIAVAHGWEVSVADADDGGARFEFTDVAVRDEPPGASGVDSDSIGTPEHSP